MTRDQNADPERTLREIGQLAPPPDAVRRSVERARMLIRRTEVRRTERPSRVPVAIAAAAVILVGWLVNAFQPNSRETLAFADSAVAVSQSMSVRYRQVNTRERFEIVDGKKVSRGTTVTSFAIFALPTGKMRYEDGHSAIVYDPKMRKRLVLLSRSKQAFLEDVSDEEAKKEPNIYADFRRIDALRLHSLGKRRRDGRSVVGFEVRQKDAPWKKGTKLWVDESTRLPVRIEFRSSNTDGTVVTTNVIEQFVFDGELDEEQFSVTPPDGFRLVKPND